MYYDTRTGGRLVLQKNPWRDEYLIPEHATDVVPPSLDDSEFAVFSDGKWAVEKQTDADVSVLDEVVYDTTGINAMDLLRSLRDEMLNATDFRVLPDYNLPDKDNWIAYRSALRELPNQIESKKVPAPTLSKEVMVGDEPELGRALLQFNHWPVEPA